MQIAIDGPSGAGKSTLAKAIASRFGMMYLDTGAMYRAIGLHVIEMNASTRDAEAVEALLDGIELDMRCDDGVTRVMLCGRDVSGLIRTQEVSMAASDVSRLAAVRKKLVQLQRSIAAGRDIVLDGRDIGTNVLPRAELKLFITAGAEVRARRRFDELTAKGVPADYEHVLQEMRRRDEQDSTRALDPLRPADDAIILDTSKLDAAQVLEAAARLVRDRIGGGC